MIRHFRQLAPAGPLALFGALLQSLIEDLAEGMKAGTLDATGAALKGASKIHAQAAADMRNGVADAICEFISKHGAESHRTPKWALQRAQIIAAGLNPQSF